MAHGIIKNCHLINAPAGSGKTTQIKCYIQNILNEDYNDNILCITYTNRAADELNKDISSKNVNISTIHSFIHSFIKIYFSHEEIIELYFECYGDQIKKRIENSNNTEKIKESNDKYKEKYGILDYNTVKENIESIYYNELIYNSLYYGGLSHDGLLEFTYYILRRYPKINKRISQKYDYIFIDEYQDTSSNVLKIFYEAVKDTDTNLYLFGDRMQQIYKNYDGSFEDELNLFTQNNILINNYRSTESIIEVLNNIYNDPKFKQYPKKSTSECEKKPIVYLCNNTQKAVERELESNDDAISLVVYNKKRFQTAKAENLYNAVSKMHRYSFGRKYSAVDILTDYSMDNPDELFRFLFLWEKIYLDYNNRNYGLVIQSIKNSNSLNSNVLLINKHKDKSHLNKILAEVLKYFDYDYNNTISIGQWLSILDGKELIKKEFLNVIYEDEYNDILEVEFREFINLINYLNYPKISTQHGVKGEGHDKVFFIAEDAGNLSVKMYDFFELWTKADIVFTEFQKFYYDLSKNIVQIELKLERKINTIQKDIYVGNKEMIDKKINEIYEKFKDNIYFKAIYMELYNDYFNKNGVTKAKKCLNLSKVHSVLSAYKLFYVGCSRAKKELAIFIDREKAKDYIEKLKEKFIEVGFEVNDYQF